jgi:thioredoxin-like negative regulator of GroEL
MLAPTVAEIAHDYAGKLKVTKLNVDEAMNSAGRYNIRGIPTLLVFKNGQVVEQIVGAVPKEQINTRRSSATSHSNVRVSFTMIGERRVAAQYGIESRACRTLKRKRRHDPCFCFARTCRRRMVLATLRPRTTTTPAQ